MVTIRQTDYVVILFVASIVGTLYGQTWGFDFPRASATVVPMVVFGASVVLVLPVFRFDLSRGWTWLIVAPIVLFPLSGAVNALLWRLAG